MAFRDPTTENDSIKSKDWNWHPKLPIDLGMPWFTLSPRKSAAWIIENYFTISDRTLIILYAVIVALWLQPVDSAQAALSGGWVAFLYARNFAVFILLTSVLHRWLYGIDGQGNLTRYSHRPYITKKNSLFKFDSQLKDNVYYSLVWGVPIATSYELLSRMAYANGVFAEISLSSNPVWFILMFPIITAWQGFHFYWVHRLLHWPPLYKHVHSVHHRNVNPGPWSGLSMHPIEHLIYFTSPMIFLVLPSSPIHMLFLINWQLLAIVTDHSGFAWLFVKDKKRLAMGGFFHQLHHRYYECNYGGTEIPLDKWFGTFHDGTEQGTIDARARKKAGKF